MHKAAQLRAAFFLQQFEIFILTIVAKGCKSLKT